MKNAWLTGAVVVLSISVLATCSGGPPDIEVATTRHDFGAVKQGQLVTAEIGVRNAGKSDLKIEAVSTSCGCTSGRIEPELIPPGGEGRLLIRYDSGAHSGSGSAQHHIYIASNDPDEAEVEVIITADVQPPEQ